MVKFTYNLIENARKRGCVMKKRSKILLSLCSTLIIAFAFTMPVIVNALEKPDESYLNWMSQIPDKTKLSSISIPGTHDSATQYCTLSYCTSCQDTSMYEQMQNGYRYIDARLELNDNQDGFIFTHGGFHCKESFWPWAKDLTFTKLCESTYNFLSDNPTETVIITIKLENSDNDVALCERLILDEINKNPNKWYTKNAIPTLGEVRGKIVLATRYEDVLNVGDELSGLHFYWAEQNNKEVVDIPYDLSMINANESLWVQDRFKYTIQDKYTAFKEGLVNCQAADNSFFINFLSLSGQGLIPHPKGNADSLNKMFMDEQLQENTSYGIIVVDRANKEMASKVFKTNF